MPKPYFITTPIYYVNDVPHIGHAYTTVAADVFCRWKKESGEAFLLTGTDEHGAKIQEAAEKRSKTPKEYADDVSGEFKRAWGDLNIQYDRFIRTTDKDHEETARHFISKLQEAGHIRKGIYKGKYCVGHEKFMSEEELVSGKCPDHGTEPINYEEENYFFPLSAFRDQLLQLIEKGDLVIEPETRKNEIMGKLREGLEDVSISRRKEKTSWGIEIPWDQDHTVYVWVEALINYYTYGKPNDLWPADIHFVGKDILWFHAIIWPAMLMAVGEATPKKVFAHGFFSIGGQKMSKTLGNVITPKELIEKFSVDGARYLLLSAFPFGTDGDFDWKRLEEKYNADLANGIGNLHSRITKLAEPHQGIILGIDEEINKNIRPLREEYKDALLNCDFFQAIQIIQKVVSLCDQLVNDKKPWTLSGSEQKKELANMLGILAGVAYLAEPFVPETSKKIFISLGIKGAPDEWGKAELKIVKGESLFPRLG